MSTDEAKSAEGKKKSAKKGNVYYAEALIKEITVTNDKASFKLEPVAPYFFEKKKDDGSPERYLLFVENTRNPSKAKIVKMHQDFSMQVSAVFHSLLIAKANRLKVRVEMDAKYNAKTLTIL